MKVRLPAICLFCLSVLFAHAQTIPPFKAGDRVVFAGNSITDGGHYHSYIWLYYLTRFPDMRINIFNAGIGGDVAQQIYDRLDSDVFGHKPNIVALTFGMNDTGYENLKADKADSVYNVRIAASLASFKLIEQKLKQHPEVQKLMMASPPYDETSKIKNPVLAGKNGAILKIAAKQQQVAAQNNWSFVDFNNPMVDIARQQQLHDPMFSFQNGDRIHPSDDGQMVMCYLFLKAQGLANKPVTKVGINVTAKVVEASDNCMVSNLMVSLAKITFNYLAKSLPYPVDTIGSGWGNLKRSQYNALAVIPFTKEFNQEVLQVKGLKGDVYTLKIDGQPVGDFATKQLADGVNLAVLNNTPQYQQALSVMHLNEERWEIERRLREYYWIHYSILKPKGLLFNDSQSTMDSLDSLQKYAKRDFFINVTMPTYRKARFKNVRDAWKKEVELLTDQLYTINKPQVRKFEIIAH